MGFNYETEWRKYAITYNGKTKKVSAENFNDEVNKYSYHFIPEIPMYVDGATVNAQCFDTKEDLVKFLRSKVEKDYILCMDSCGEIIEVRNNYGYPWYVMGYTNLGAWTFPNWENHRESDEAREKREKKEHESNHFKIVGIKSASLVDNGGKELFKMNVKPYFL